MSCSRTQQGASGEAQTRDLSISCHAMVRLKPETSRSRVMHPTSEPLCSSIQNTSLKMVME